MMDNFLQPGLIMIISGLLVLIIPEKLRGILMIAAPLLTGYAVVTSGADKLTMMVGIIFSIVALIAATYNVNVKDRTELCVEAIYAGSSISCE